MMRNRPSWPWRGLLPQLFALVILPLTLLLLVFAFGNTIAHQQAMRSMVGGADERAVRSAAAALSAEISHRLETLRVLGEASETGDAISLQGILERTGPHSGFDYGIAFFTSSGDLLAASGGTAAGGGENRWAELAQSSPAAILPPEGEETTISSLVKLPGSAEKSIVMAYRLGTETAGPTAPLVIAGAFSPERLARQTLDQALPGEQMSVALYGSDGQMLYQSSSQLSQNEQVYSTSDHPGLREALSGQSGLVTVQSEQGEHIVAYSPVPAADWALLAEESWEMLAGPALELTQIAPLILVPLLLIFLAALWFGARQVIQPLQSLESQAASVAWGNYDEIERPVGGIAEIRRLQAELIHLTQKVRASQQSLHNYIGAITAGQEEERSRLARELHDDTLQSLIALKQRVQLARLALQGQPASESLAELEELAEQTIANLRRLTGALRPIYLEDLGLVIALEMLAREAGVASGVSIQFQRQGEERRLPADVELSLYRIAQEAISNIVRHSGASQALLSIQYQSDDVTLSVQDNGKGFTVPASPAEFAPGGHFGLLGLHERAELIGSELKIRSSPEGGTQLTIRWMSEPSEAVLAVASEGQLTR